MRFHQLSVLSVLAAVPFADSETRLPPPWHDIHVKHTWNAVPPNWEALGYPPARTTIDLHVALKPHHENALVDALYEVSDPRSPKYGAHLSKEQVAQLVAPHPDTHGLINSWLGHHAVPSSSISTTHGGSWLKLTGIPVLQANELLGASYQVYRCIGTNDSSILRTVGYGLPSGAACARTNRDSNDVLHLHGCSAADSAEAHRRRDSEYGYVGARDVAVDSRGSRISVGPALTVPDSRICASGNGPECARGYGLLGILSEPGGFDGIHDGMSRGRDRRDLRGRADQWRRAIAFPTPHTFYSTGGGVSIDDDDNEPASDDMWLQWVYHVLDLEDIPQTISTSYGDYETSLPPEYAETMCDLYAQLGARGASVIFSSGNDGVGKGDCLAQGGSGVHFIPGFPASCPFVTSVGGTMDIPESAAPFSGGGFSNYFSQPPYQSVAVPAFLRQLGDKYHGFYNAEGRGFPDISAQAVNFFTIDDNESYLVEGTSCSVPTVAGIISLLNDYRLANNRRPLGFLNPWLYGIGIDGLNDITSGSNPGCGTDGFSAIVGWDPVRPVTGLGTPDFLRLQNTFASLPSTSDTSDT
ncbi:subtilisin-like protein [Lactarius sanguifluus]|nr:subtilisin-like protein [Lactarius sanguifluus]